MAELNSKIPKGPVAQKWSNYKAHQNLVNPSNKRKLDIIIVGTGLAGASAAASFGELGFNVKIFCYQDSPVVHIVLQPREVSMQRRITQTTATACIVCFTTH